MPRWRPRSTTRRPSCASHEARTAEGKNRDEESFWRSEEASLHADIVQEKIKLRGLERTVSEIETGIATLRRELNS